MDELERVLNELKESATDLSKMLEKVRESVVYACGKDLNSMSIGEKIKVAELLIDSHKKFNTK